MIMFFVQGRNLPTTETDLYFGSRSEKKTEAENTNVETDSISETKVKKKQQADFSY